VSVCFVDIGGIVDHHCLFIFFPEVITAILFPDKPSQIIEI
jgi:hypothetical protein